MTSNEESCVVREQMSGGWLVVAERVEDAVRFSRVIGRVESAPAGFTPALATRERPGDAVLFVRGPTASTLGEAARWLWTNRTASW